MCSASPRTYFVVKPSTKWKSSWLEGGASAASLLLVYLKFCLSISMVLNHFDSSSGEATQSQSMQGFFDCQWGKPKWLAKNSASPLRIEDWLQSICCFMKKNQFKSISQIDLLIFKSIQKTYIFSPKNQYANQFWNQFESIYKIHVLWLAQHSSFPQTSAILSLLLHPFTKVMCVTYVDLFFKGIKMHPFAPFCKGMEPFPFSKVGVYAKPFSQRSCLK